MSGRAEATTQILLVRAPGALALGVAVDDLAVKPWAWVDAPPRHQEADLGLVTYAGKVGTARARDLLLTMGLPPADQWSWMWNRSQALVWRIPGEPLLVTGVVRPGHPPTIGGSWCRSHAVIDGLIVSLVDLAA
jgi:hypothetical protein